MATRRKRYVRSKRVEYTGEAFTYANFAADLLDGTVKAIALVESRDGRGNLVLDYDDPNG